MSLAPATPCAVLFDTMKRQGHVSYKNTAALILSGRPLSDGRSPASRVEDRTWVSRFVVHAPVGSLQDDYFGDFVVSALRLISRLKARNGRDMTSERILELVTDADNCAMDRALEACGQPSTLYRNALDRLAIDDSLTAEERAEVAMVLFVTAACTGNVRRAVARALDFSQSAHGAAFVTPATVPEAPAGSRSQTAPARLGLLAVEDGYVHGAPYWLSPTIAGTQLGSLALTAGAVTDVAADVSAEHARIWLDAEGVWLIEGLDSRNGTVLVDGVTGEETVVELPRDARKDGESSPVELHPGDRLRLGSTTTFVVVEGRPD